MTFLPIVERELRGRARRGFTYWLRVGVGAFGVLICLVQFVFSGVAGGGSTAGAYAFNALLTAAFMYCCCSCLMTATAISSERSEGTLPLLFLTRVKSDDVLIGKLLPSLLAGLCTLAAFLPVLMIPVLTGGVTGGETFRSALVLIHTLFLALVLGLHASVRAANWIGAVRGALLHMLGWLFLPYVVGTVGMCFLVPWQIFGLLSPIRVLFLASESQYPSAPASFWIGLAVLQVVGWVLLWRTGARLRDTLRDQKKQLIAPSSETLPLYRSIGDGDPIQWLIHRQRAVRSMIWFGAGIALVDGFGFHIFYHVSRFGLGMFFAWPVTLASNILESALFAWAITRFFIRGRRTGELEQMATTPYGARMLVTAQYLALRELFRGPVAAMVLPIVIRLLVWMWSMNAQLEWSLLALGSAIFSAVNLLLGIAALIWTGMGAGLTASNQGRAMAVTVWWVTLLPTLMYWALSLILNVFYFRGPTSDLIRFLLPSLAIAALFLGLIYRARRRLARELPDAEILRGDVPGKPATPDDATPTTGKASHWTSSEPTE